MAYNSDIKIRGDTDNTLIGNVGDKLKVDASATTVSVVSQDSAQFYANNNQLYTVGFNINQPTAGSNNPLLLFRNPTGSGYKIILWKITCGVKVTNVFTDFKLFATPTVTSNGTTLDYYPCNIGNSQPAGVSLLTTTPTISASGSQMNALQIGQNNNGSSLIEDFSVYIQPNNAVLITGDPSSNNREAVVTVIWAEVSI